jgi:signal transduction histidine kinase
MGKGFLPRRFERRIYVGLFLLLCAFVPVLLASYSSFRELVREEREYVDLRAHQAVLTERLNTQFERQLSLVPVFVLTGDRRILPVLESERAALLATLGTLIQLADTAEERSDLGAIKAAEAKQNDLAVLGIRMREQGQPVAAVNHYFRNSTGPGTDSLRTALAGYTEFKHQQHRAARAALEHSAAKTETALMVVTAFTLLFLCLVCYLMVRELRRKARADRELALTIDRERALSRRRKDTVDIVSHDLRNPIAALKLRMQLLARRGDAAVKRDVDASLLTVNAMESLVRDLLDHTKIEAGKLPLDRRTCDAQTLLDGVAARLAPLAEERGVDLTFQLEPGFPALDCDPARIGQVLDNLVGNALKFTPAGGTVRVSTAHQSRQVMFAVSDSGPGIAPENLPRVFDRFWQEPGTRAKGNGLGLAIAKGVVEAHGGRIWVESRAGHGAEFFFTVPLMPAPAALHRPIDLKARL